MVTTSLSCNVNEIYLVVRYCQNCQFWVLHHSNFGIRKLRSRQLLRNVVFMILCLAIMVHCWLVTDGQRHGHNIYRASVASRSKNLTICGIKSRRMESKISTHVTWLLCLIDTEIQTNAKLQSRSIKSMWTETVMAAMASMYHFWLLQLDGLIFVISIIIFYVLLISFFIHQCFQFIHVFHF